MQKTVLQTIKVYSMISPGDSIVVGLSGGADSVALLHVLMSLQAELGISQISAVHVNHGLRGDAAASDEAFVCDLCSSLQIPLKIYQADVRGLSKKESMSIEEAGRKLRYFYMEEAVLGMKNAKIATGHHQNDNAETVIMNLARGSGLRGLCGIPPRNGKIIRPLLDISRIEIEKYMASHALKYITDASNLSHEYTRNCIRLEILPAIEKAVNPQVTQTIAKNATWLRADEEYLQTLAMEAFILNRKVEDNNKAAEAILLDAAALATLPLPISSRVIRLAIRQIRLCQGHLSNITASHIYAVLELVQMKSGKEVRLPGLVAYKEYSQIVITVPASPAKFGSYPLQLPSLTDIPELNMTVSVSRTEPKKLCPPNLKKPILYCTNVFEYGIVTEGLVLRSRHSGDKINLQGERPFTKKIQDYFTDTKTPKHKRDRVPILACGNDILWILDKKSPVSAKYTHINGNEKKYQNPFWVTLWSEADADD